jgi:predicted O-methyltransferase YrrM
VDFAFTFANGFLRPGQVRSEIRKALEVIETIQPKVIVEIGTAGGGNLFLLSRAAHAHAYLASVDLPAGNWGGGYQGWKIPVFRRLLLKGQRADFIRADSHNPSTLEELKRRLRGKLIDVLFIDGDHSYAGVKQDFDFYSRLVRPGGLVLLHDIVRHRPEDNCHVDQLWAELRQRYDSREFIEDRRQAWAGIGLMQMPKI